MKRTTFAIALSLGLLAGAVCLQPGHAFADAGGQKQVRQPDSQIQTEMQAALKADRFKDVRVTVRNGVIDLAGTVELYADKEEAARKAQRNKNASSVRNDIQVAKTELSDEELQNKLLEKVQYDRVGYGTTPFNAISVSVRDGVATLSGHAYGPTDRDSAVSLASHMRGILDVIDEVQVDPLSPMDDHLRLQVARSIYGYPTLNKYAIDPVKPIRISVQNGNVTLYGMVDSQMDKDVAALRANGVPGIFNVVNRLQVAGETPQRD